MTDCRPANPRLWTGSALSNRKAEIMAIDEPGVEKALDDLKKAERKVELDEERLERDQAKVEQALEEVEDAEHKHLVTIIVDGTERKVRAGQWIVRDLKAALQIDPAKVLAEVTPHGLKDLDDGAEITVREGERFMTHARTGGSS